MPGGLDLDFGPVSATLTTGDGVLVGLVITALLLATATGSAWLEARLAARLITNLRGRLFRGLLSASWERQAGIVEARFQDLIMVHTYRLGNLVLILTGFLINVLGLLALAAAALVLDVVTAGVLVVEIVGALALLFRPLVTGIRERSAAHVEVNHEYIDELADTFGVLPEIRVLGVRAAATERLDAISAKTVAVYRPMMFRGRVLARLYLGATAALLLVGLAIADTQGRIELEQVGAIVVFLLRSLRYSQQAQSGWQAALEVVPNLEAVESALQQWRPTTGEFGTRRLERAGVLEFRQLGTPIPQDRSGSKASTSPSVRERSWGWRDPPGPGSPRSLSWSSACGGPPAAAI